MTSGISENRVGALLLQDLALEDWKSMDLYADQLQRHLPSASPRYHYIWPTEYRTISPPRAPAGLIHQAGRFYARYISYPAALKHYQGEITHILDHSYAHLLRGRDCKRAIITVHDLYPYYKIASGSRGLRGRVRTKLLRWVMDWCRQAARLIAVSHFTAGEIARLMNYPEARIRVVENGVDEKFFQPVEASLMAALRARYRLPDEKIILHVGSCVERKNIEALFGVLARCRASGQAAHLLQAGGRFTNSQQGEIDRLGLGKNITQINYVADGELPAIYHLADLFLFPSSYEGFGLPLLEAMACGLPIVAAQAASLPEVAGNAALLARADDWDGLAQAALRIIKERNLSAELAAAGSERATNFSWSKTAMKIAAIYDEL